MGLRFRKSVKIAPGVRLNFGKKSASVSLGGKGARLTINNKGKKTASVGIPGTGLYYTESIGGTKKRKEHRNMAAKKTGNVEKSKKTNVPKEDKPKTPITKKWWFWAIAVCLVGSIISGPGEDPPKGTLPESAQEEILPSQEEQAESILTEESEAVESAQEEITAEPEAAAPTPETPEETKAAASAPETPEEPPKEPKKAVEEPKAETPAVIPVVTPVPEAPAAEADPEAAFRELLNQYNYVGSSESDKYHHPQCRWTNKINDQNLIHFDTELEAEAAGYTPCGTCKP